MRPLPESATTDHIHPIPQPDTKPGRTRRRRNDHGFSMLELLVGMVILGILGAIGYGIYTNFIGDARDTALDQNIQTAAAEIQSVLALEPTLASNIPELVTAMTNRTNFVWDGTTWVFQPEDEPDTIRFQFLGKATAAIPSASAAPMVDWIVGPGSAVRIHLTNPEGEWRCALLVLKPSTSTIAGIGTLTPPADAAKAAELRGIWFDGGTAAGTTTPGLHDCSPVSSRGAGTWAVSATSDLTCTDTGTVMITDHCLPANAQTWQIPVAAASVELDTTSSAVTNTRTLHRSASSLDTNA